ncbi:MAG: YoaK family protein, partial [Filifactor alocis]|nr:YoaK family protein [Filifactor alocis]
MQAKYQMSESLRLGLFLTLSGGFQDAYSYICRGKVFVNAQTGNIVLLGQNLAEGNYKKAVTYLFPLLSFTAGAYLCQRIKLMSKPKYPIHWRQLILLMEIFLLFCAGLLPSRYDTLANMTLSFVCAMQVVAFGKFHNNPYATTMCIGNLKSATTLLCRYRITKEVVSGKTSLC